MTGMMKYFQTEIYTLLLNLEYVKTKYIFINSVKQMTYYIELVCKGINYR